MLAASLAIAEGRPARRSLRRLVPRLPSTIDGASAFLLDVSSEGLRLEMSREAGAKLGPQFLVQVPFSSVGVTVRRVWVRAETSAGQPRVQCGASLVSSDPRTMDAWQQMLQNAPEGAESPARSACAAGPRPPGAGEGGTGPAVRPRGADDGRRADRRLAGSCRGAAAPDRRSGSHRPSPRSRRVAAAPRRPANAD